MSNSTNLVLFLIGINLMLFLFSTNPSDPINGTCTYCSPLFTIASGLVTGNWAAVLVSLGSSAWIYFALFGLVILASWSTGATPLSGGGYGSILTLQVLAIGIFASLIGMPNFAAMNMPLMITIVLDVIFGGLIIISLVGLLRGTD
jgi:hypothetical protein